MVCFYHAVKYAKQPIGLGKVDAFMYYSHSSPLVCQFFFYEAKYVVNITFQAQHWEMFAQLACVHVVQVSNWQMKWMKGLKMLCDLELGIPMKLHFLCPED